MYAIVIYSRGAQVANLFVREGRSVFIKHWTGRTIVFIKDGTNCTFESLPKFQNSSLLVWYIYTDSNIVGLYQEYL